MNPKRFVIPSAARNLLVLIPLAFLAVAALGQEKPAPAMPVHEIKMTAKKYEFNPEEIRVQQGERVRLLITATDRRHGFQIKELDINVVLEKGKETAVEFVADKPGEYNFNCSVRCGWKHPWMDGKLIVDPATKE